MKLLAILATLTGLTSVAGAAPFRPFVDSVGLTKDGAIVTTTSVGFTLFAPDGTEVLTVQPRRLLERGIRIDARQQRALKAWVTSLGARRVALAPLLELKCRDKAAKDVDLPVCPANATELVRTDKGLGRWNPGARDPYWGWGEPKVAEIESSVGWKGESLQNVCVLILPANSGTFDDIVASTVPCPAHSSPSEASKLPALADR